MVHSVHVVDKLTAATKPSNFVSICLSHATTVSFRSQTITCQAQEIQTD